MPNFKKSLVITSAITLPLLISVVSLTNSIAPVSADIQCPGGWTKEMHGVAEVCVAQHQDQNQAQIQNNNQNQNVNNSASAWGGSSSSSSSSSSNSEININSWPSATPAVTTVYTYTTPQVVYQAQAPIKYLPKTGPAETAFALMALLPLGLVLMKFQPKFAKKETYARATWLKRSKSL